MRELMSIRDWVKALGLLCAGNASTKDCQAKASAYAPMLAREFKPAAFTTESLTAVARDCAFFPSFGELCRALSAWWDENRPYVPTVALLTGPRPDIPTPRDPPTEAELAAIDGIMRAFRMEHPTSCPSRDRPPEVAPKQLSTGVLMATYERLAAQGDKAARLRVEMLHRQLQSAADPPTGKTWPFTEAEADA